MRTVLCWVLVIFLAGCQTTQQDDPSSKDVEVNSKAEGSTSYSDNEFNTTDKSQSVLLSPQQQDDVWQRIAMQLYMPVPDHSKIDYYRSWYLAHPKHLAHISERAKPFLYLIVEKIEQRNLPLELALLPVVESAFDPFAYSHGSAAGLWQFVPGTGKMFGLQQNYWYDGRRDVDRATDAALDYLSSLNQRFSGNWNHAIAAYNSGGGRVSRAITKNQQKGLPIDFFSLDLPKETSSYVPKLLALADVIANKDIYQLSIPPIANKPVLKLVDPKEQLDLSIAAEYADLSVTELQSYNPAYNQWATAPDGPFHFLLPIDRVAQFTQQAEENRGKGIKMVRYRVKSGDSISVIAKKHNTTSATIRSTNSISGNLIRVGQYLMIPMAKSNGGSYPLSASNRLAKTQSTKVKGKYKQEYTVASGDNLWSISRKYNVSYQALAKWNGMGPRDTLRVGQKLVIWTSSDDGSIIRTVHYKVRSGDTISAIANRFKVKSADIVKWNNLTRNKYIQPGQHLKLYVDVTKVSV